MPDNTVVSDVHPTQTRLSADVPPGERRKTISIVTPFYNEEESIVECVETIRTLFAEKLPNYDLEHIFCDNCSTDSTLDILKKMARSDSRLSTAVGFQAIGAE